jgi:hypothetical protein
MSAEPIGPLPSLEEEAWDTLVDSILADQCTPFLGAGVAVDALPDGKQLAIDLADKFGYPLTDSDNLARVTQFLATSRQPRFAKRRVVERITRARLAYLERSGGEPPRSHQFLAKLGLSFFITTNYDDFLELALERVGRTPRAELCRWNDDLLEELGGYPNFTPTVDDPVVFHLHGNTDSVDSVLVTEDDYVDFTVDLALRRTENAVLWHRVRRQLSRTTLLFVGYSLEDWNFRVLMRYLMEQQRIRRSDQMFCLSIQLSPRGMRPEQRARAETFVDRFLGNATIKIHWTDASTFLEELHRRVEGARR